MIIMILKKKNTQEVRNTVDTDGRTFYHLSFMVLISKLHCTVVVLLVLTGKVGNNNLT